MKIVSFYNDIEGSTFYSDCAKRLAANCDRLGLEYMILRRNYGSTWLQNIQAKPTFIKEMIVTLQKPFIYVDVDSTIHSIDFEIKGDWGCVMRPNDEMPYDHCHYIDCTKHNEFTIDTWIERVNKAKLCDHSAFLTVWGALNHFWIPNGFIDFGLGQSKGRTEYLTWAENNLK